VARTKVYLEINLGCAGKVECTLSILFAYSRLRIFFSVSCLFAFYLSLYYPIYTAGSAISLYSIYTCTIFINIYIHQHGLQRDPRGIPDYNHTIPPGNRWSPIPPSDRASVAQRLLDHHATPEELREANYPLEEDTETIPTPEVDTTTINHGTGSPRPQTSLRRLRLRND
jgi:hypothetical protein